ncbi:hypothetical protein [Acinetobacter junii]|uniref:hypothetical protein n=1 Tax=Acinetobacter junii TaxID=40215 RepID=UPI00102EBEE8|nr:hypothetical protein [Acinetobacter junii]RZG70473.1 hypothetical protein EXE26_02030 [Acinetobacter junii]
MGKVVVVNTKEELKAAIKASAYEIELVGEVLKQYKAALLLKNVGLLSAGVAAGSMVLGRFIPGLGFASVLKQVAQNSDKIDLKLIIQALMLLAPVMAIFIAVMTALLKDYEEIDGNLNGSFKFRKKSK